jgi:hypothetical protein
MGGSHEVGWRSVLGRAVWPVISSTGDSGVSLGVIAAEVWRLYE